jgi:DNA-binding SARP family transcriptional activator/tetratricopeptide (TPR) repeat protein
MSPTPVHARTLHIRLLGAFSLTYDEEPVESVNTARLQSLLAYLVLHHDSAHLRQHLAFLFWPDSSEAQARNSLRQMLHGLRQALPDAGAFLAADYQTLRWRVDGRCTVDVLEFERALDEADQMERTGDSSGMRRALEHAIGLYQSDLLPGCYDDWIAPERERLRRRHLNALGRLVRLVETEGDYELAIHYAERLVAGDLLDEASYRVLMRLHLLNGNRGGAQQTYRRCAAILRAELGLELSQATREAAERVVDEPSQLSPAAPRPDDGGVLARNTLVPLIGRQRDWNQLRDVWHRASVGQPELVLVTGEAGIGKSRLAEELLLWVERQDIVAAKTRSYPAEGQLSLAPVADWLRGPALRPHLAHLDPVWLGEIARIMPELLNAYPGLPSYGPISEFGQRQRFFQALALAVLAAPPPLLLIIDDLQWCDQETFEWLHFLLRFDPAARLLLLGTLRSEELTPRHPLRTQLLALRDAVVTHEIALQPLDAAETARLGEEIGHSQLGTDAAVRLYRETEGNPLFVVETMRAGLESVQAGDDISRDQPGSSSLAGGHALPPRVHATIAHRLAQLSPRAYALTTLAAAIGREFRLDVLCRAGNLAEEEAVQALDELWHRRLVREQGLNTYDFTHDKLREVAYAEISAPQRRLLHSRVARALEAIHAEHLDPVSGQIATHNERAGLLDEAILYYQRAASTAQRVYANEDAINLLTRCLSLLEQLPHDEERDRRELSVLLQLSPIYRVTRGWTAPELERAVYRTLDLCDAVGNDALRAETLDGMQSLLVVQAHLARVLEVATAVQDLYQRSHGELPLLSGMYSAGAHFHMGRFVEANRAFAQMITEHSELQPENLQQTQGWNSAILSRSWQSHALWCLGYPQQALDRATEAVRLAGELSLPFNQALASAYRALLLQVSAEAPVAREAAEEALRLSVEHKAPYYRAWSAILVQFARAWEQPSECSVADLRAAIVEFKSTGARLRLPYYCWLLACLCQRFGQPESGLAAIQEGLAAAEASGERWWDAELYRTRAELMLASGSDTEHIEAALAQAARVAHAQKAKSLELRVAMSLARVRRGQQQLADARRVLQRAYTWFTEGHNSPDLRAARLLLAELP